ncbi:MAG TPA: DnaA/Hda family protein [Hyphomicrobiaceae bacterium]|nr:DnaA/Hda family protein [Hyphomicrobiaceae bacterium]
MSAPHQLVLDLGHRPALGAEDFHVTASNETAIALVDRWPNWPGPAVYIQGPAKSGKTHLVNVWRHMSHAPVQAAEALDDTAIPLLLEQKALAVEDIDRGIASERSLFHLLNAARENNARLLLTGRRPTGEIEIALPDLRSRLRALPIAVIEPPDDALLAALLVKHFSDRQLLVDPPVIAYLTQRMERSAAAAAALVEAIDRRALATHRRVTRALASEVILAREVGMSPE